ncbi:sporulation histidine kinase inhibitor Sda [Rossellomorea vietnamensis]|uniref:Sporulation histidine kinase inhibitor Sda n=1 Tax=Rossellomorea vietnamensis TaxID=218284 RepID=A0A5D4MI05_9BACI|nr:MULTISPECIES: sporulation histidine kinase inhibitor Sda [Bacillaceae]TYS01545.1 sporulation histidine kinase inhibitor Sda [Rossellomorea vietnamensis]
MSPKTLKYLTNKQLLTVWRHAKTKNLSEEYLSLIKKEMRRRMTVTYKR